MQNKKPLLQRLLVIYITFFIVLIVSIAHSIVPGFSNGYNEGTRVGNDIVKSWAEGSPRMIYMLQQVWLKDTRNEIVRKGSAEVEVRPCALYMIVEEDAPEDSVMELALSSIGGSPWIYAAVMLSTAAFLAIIVLMFLIIHSLRRSIREERALDRRNVWLLRAIGGLTICSELLRDAVAWSMSGRAARLLEESQYVVDTAFRVNYSTLIMGILILFAAEVFAIGQNLSEEQKLTI